MDSLASCLFSVDGTLFHHLKSVWSGLTNEKRSLENDQVQGTEREWKRSQCPNENIQKASRTSAQDHFKNDKQVQASPWKEDIKKSCVCKNKGFRCSVASAALK